MTYDLPARMPIRVPRWREPQQAQVHIDFKDLVAQAVENERQRLVREAIRAAEGVKDDQPAPNGRYPYTEPREGPKVKADIIAALGRLA